MFLAGVAHPVERHLAKVEVASSSLVTRSIKNKSHPIGMAFVFAKFQPRGSNNPMLRGRVPPAMEGRAAPQFFLISVRENANELRHLPNNSRTDMQHRRMYFMNITIQDLQSYLSHCYSGWATEQSMFMKLVEEIGEVAEVLNKRAGR